MPVEGRVQKSAEGGTHLMATNIIDKTDMLGQHWEAHKPHSKK
jgi:hypothetical protein